VAMGNIRVSALARTAALAVAIITAVSVGIRAQETQQHQQTTTPPNARFEVLSSSLAARFTFRLDRFTGHVAQLVKTNDDDDAWEEMDVVGLPTTVRPDRARFQLFSSGIAARYTFLIDTDTGHSWVIATSSRVASDGTKSEVTIWVPFAN
jgi:hypothetical protein